MNSPTEGYSAGADNSVLSSLLEEISKKKNFQEKGQEYSTMANEKFQQSTSYA